MKFKMAENSLFAILLRSRWWVSAAIAIAMALAARAVLPAEYAVIGAMSALPFVVIAAMAGWKQLHTPSAARVADVVQVVSAMAWPEFADAVEAAYRRDGHTVTRLAGPDADFELTKAGRTTLVSCKRWKAARMGVEPLRELHAAARKREAQHLVCIALGELSDNARAFAREQGIAVLQGDGVAQLLRGIELPRPRAA